MMIFINSIHVLSYNGKMEVYEMFEKIRREKPLVHHITNYVTIYDCANMTLAFGALPVMAQAIEESGDMAKIASSLVLNIGTLTLELIESMIVAGDCANKKGIPVVLDAVGAGATRLRDESTRELLERIGVDVLKGNASEIARIAGEDVSTRGVESTKVDADLADIAERLAKDNKSTIVVTGRDDIVSDGINTYVVRNGHEMMGHVVGTGCMAASVIGAFVAVEKDYPLACAGALSTYGIAAELAAGKSNGPGSFRSNLYDEAYNLDRQKIQGFGKIEKTR